MADKIKTAKEVVASIPNGSHIALGGYGVARNCIVPVHELIRQGRKSLTVSQGGAGLDTDLLVGSGAVSRLIIGGGSLDRFGPLPCINRARERQELAIEDWTSLAISFRYLAGALGLSFMPIKSLIGSDILDRLQRNMAAGDLARATCPFTSEDYLLLRALTPDVAFIHVQWADYDGNCRIDGPRWDNEEQAKAAKRVIVIAEEVGPVAITRKEPGRTILPGHRVEAVIHQPYGAYPTAVLRHYDYDVEHMQLYIEHARNPALIDGYIDTYVRTVSDHRAYLRKAGAPDSLLSLQAHRRLGY